MTLLTVMRSPPPRPPLCVAVDHADHMLIEPQTAIEGEDITLTCRATRYLYSELQWLDAQNRTIASDVSPPPGPRLDPYSVSLALTLRNVSRESSTPAYCCVAHNHFNNKSTHKTFVLNVDGKQTPPGSLAQGARSHPPPQLKAWFFGARNCFWL